MVRGTNPIHRYKNAPDNFQWCTEYRARVDAVRQWDYSNCVTVVKMQFAPSPNSGWE